MRRTMPRLPTAFELRPCSTSRTGCKDKTLKLDTEPIGHSCLPSP